MPFSSPQSTFETEIARANITASAIDTVFALEWNKYNFINFHIEYRTLVNNNALAMTLSVDNGVTFAAVGYSGFALNSVFSAPAFATLAFGAASFTLVAAITAAGMTHIKATLNKPLFDTSFKQQLVVAGVRSFPGNSATGNAWGVFQNAAITTHARIFTTLAITDALIIQSGIK